MQHPAVEGMPSLLLCEPFAIRKNQRASLEVAKEKAVTGADICAIGVGLAGHIFVDHYLETLNTEGRRCFNGRAQFLLPMRQDIRSQPNSPEPAG